MFNALPIVTILFIIGKLLQQPTGKVSAKPAMLQLLLLTAILHRASIAPKGFGNQSTAFATHFLSIPARATEYAAS